MKFSDIPSFPRFHYSVNVPWESVDKTLEDYAKDGLDMDPDFQRAHVWTEQQQASYIEYMLRGGEVGRRIIFNNEAGVDDPWWGKMILIDGKQRLEAVRKFLNDEIRTFGHLFSEFEGRMRIFQNDFVFCVCNLRTRADILQLYLNINAGGTPHTQEELDRVRELLRKETGG